MAAKRGRKIVLYAFLVIAVITAVYFTFFFSYSCDNIPCFQSHQEECVSTEYVKDSVDSTILFKVQGKSKGMCEVDVTVLSVKAGTIDKQSLEGLKMTCSLPIGDTSSPEDNLQNCQGPLKEELQHLIIQKMHAYILDNLGDIGEELGRII